MMQIIKIISLSIVLFNAKANYPDPFKSLGKSKVQVLQKYQYLGYIKGPDVFLGFIRQAGGGVETLKYGKNPGFGKVTTIDKNFICIVYHKQQWCLDRSTQVKPWRKQ